MRITLSKTEKIMSLLNQWDPTGEYAKSDDYRCYSYEADTIACSIRKNSKIEKVEMAIKEVFPHANLNPEHVRLMAGYILQAIKQ